MKKAGLVFFLIFGALPLRAGLSVGGRALSGDHGYKERALAAELKIAPKFEWDDPDIPQPFTGFSFRFTRTGYKREGIGSTTYNTRGGVGTTLFGHATLDFDYSRTPELSESSGAYRSRGWNLAASGWWDGWVPNVEGGSGPSLLETRVAASIGRVDHEEHIQVSTAPIEWRGLGEDVITGTIAQTYWKITTVRIFGATHSFDQDPRQLAVTGRFLPLSATAAAGPYALLNGFARREWGAGVSQYVGPRVVLAADWTRASYDLALSPRSDTTVLSGTLYLGLYVTLNARHEMFKPLNASQSSYTGFGLGVGF